MPYEFLFLNDHVHQIITCCQSTVIKQDQIDKWQHRIRKKLFLSIEKVTKKMPTKLENSVGFYLETQCIQLQNLVNKLTYSVQTGALLTHSQWIINELEFALEILETQREAIYTISDDQLISMNLNVDELGLLANICMRTGLFRENNKRKVAHILSSSFTSKGKKGSECISTVSLSKSMSYKNQTTFDQLQIILNQLKKELRTY